MRAPTRPFRRWPQTHAPAALADVQTGVLREEVSRQGRVIRLSLNRGTYQGARPYFTVAYLHRKGPRPQVVRYTPLRDRAEWLFARFCEDLIKPAPLAPTKSWA